MSSKIVAFDLEIIKEIPEGIDWKNIRPLGISCVALLPNEQIFSNLYYSDDLSSSAIRKKALQSMIKTMMMWQKEGLSILTWNGLQFDFDVLAEESGMYDECKELALNHIDMMFHFFCVKGYPVGLEAVSNGLGLGGKMAGMSGAQAPQLWASEKLSDRLKVLRYVHQDVVATLDIFERAEELGMVSWITKKGKLSHAPLFPQGKFLTVKECLDMPLPDTSWMDKPLTREEFYDWIK